MRKRTMKVSSLIFVRSIDRKRKNVCFFDEFSLRKDDRSRQMKDKTTDQSMFCSTDSSNKKRNSTRLAQSSMLNGKSPSDNFSLFIPKIYSSKTQIVRRIDKISRRRIDWKDQRFFSKTKHFFLHSNIFIRKEKCAKDLFISTQPSRWKTVQSISQIRCRWKINESKMKIEEKRNAISKRKFAKFGQNSTILHEKIRSIPIRMTSKNTELNGEFQHTFDSRFKPKWKCPKKTEK